MTQTPIPPFEPGMQFRQFDITGACTVLEETKEEPSIRMVFYKIPDGSVRKTYAHALYRRLYITKEFIPEPELKGSEIDVRVWISSEKRMIYSPSGIIGYSKGYGPNLRSFQIFTGTRINEYGQIYEEKDITIMHACNYKSGNGKEIYPYDVVCADSDSSSISIVFAMENSFILIDFNNSKQTLTSFSARRFNKIGNIFENPEYYDLFVKSQHIIRGK